MQTTKYKRITNNERGEISRSLALGKSITEISKELGRHRVTMSEKLIGTAEKVDIVPSQPVGGRRIQLDHGAKEKPN